MISDYFPFPLYVSGLSELPESIFPSLPLKPWTRAEWSGRSCGLQMAPQQLSANILNVCRVTQCRPLTHIHLQYISIQLFYDTPQQYEDLSRCCLIPLRKTSPGMNLSCNQTSCAKSCSNILFFHQRFRRFQKLLVALAGAICSSSFLNRSSPSFCCGYTITIFPDTSKYQPSLFVELHLQSHLDKCNLITNH